MKNVHRLFSMVTILALLTLACSVDFIGGEALPESVLFQDDFSSTGSGWDRDDFEEGYTDYEDGKYRILVKLDDQSVWANPGLHFTDVIIQVEATKAGGPDDNDFGVICRYVDVENFYYFIITSDGYYGIIKVQDGYWEYLVNDSLIYSEAINQGGASNTLRADCVGDTLTLYVNGIFMDEAYDSDYTSGDVGLIAGTYDEPGTDILFDNFSVMEP